MEIDNGLLDSVTNLINTNIEKPLVCKTVELIDKKNRKSKRYLFASDV